VLRLAAAALQRSPSCLTAGPRSYLSSPVEVIDFVVVVLSVANAASGKLLNLNMIRMVRCAHMDGVMRTTHSCIARR
jgi:Ion transport protein